MARTDDPITREQTRGALVIGSRLLAYPTEQLLDDLPAIREVVAGLPDQWQELARNYLAQVEGRDLLRLQADYVATFDLKRRCCLYLTYYLNGDTRRRGMALWRFQETYRMAGWAVSNGELPDFLPVLLEFAAAGREPELAARQLLQEHRGGLEVLRAALSSTDSPAAHLVSLVLATLPELTPAQHEEARELVAQGPPAESVGRISLQPFSAVDESIGARA